MSLRAGGVVPFNSPSTVGEANTSSNSGGGDGLALAKDGVDLPFKSLTAGANITLTPSADEIEISATGGGGGEANTSSNSGGGAGLAQTKSGVDLPFKSLVAGSGISLTPTADEITIAATGGGVNSDTIIFRLNGKPTPSNDVDGAWIAPRACTITRVTLFRRTAGGSGSTTIDIDIEGVTIFTTQANRPTVTQAAGDDQIDAVTNMDVTAIAQDERLEMNIDVVESGNPQDVSVIVEVVYT